MTESLDVLRKKVVAVKKEACPSSERIHVTGVQLEDGGMLSSADAIELMNAGAAFYMIPPPGAPAYEAHMATGLPLILQSRTCEHCRQEVLFA